MSGIINPSTCPVVFSITNTYRYGENQKMGKGVRIASLNHELVKAFFETLPSVFTPKDEVVVSTPELHFSSMENSFAKIPKETLLFVLFAVVKHFGYTLKTQFTSNLQIWPDDAHETKHNVEYFVFEKSQ